MSALDGVPGFVGAKFIGTGQPAFGSVEIAELARGACPEGGKVRANAFGCGRIVGERFEKIPDGEWSTKFEECQPVIILRLRIRLVVTIGAEMEFPAKAGCTEVHRKAATDETGIGIDPVLERAELPCARESLQAETARIKITDGEDIRGRDGSRFRIWLLGQMACANHGRLGVCRQPFLCAREHVLCPPGVFTSLVERAFYRIVTILKYEVPIAAWGIRGCVVSHRFFHFSDFWSCKDSSG